MTHPMPTSASRPYHAVATLIERHGVWRVLRAVFSAMIQQRSARRLVPPHGLSNHLRRDIGLAPKATDRRKWPPPF